MPTYPDSGVSFTVKTNGQTLRVAAGTSASSLVQELYSDAACASLVTTPESITSDTTYYLPRDMANSSVYISCKQPDGTELWGKKQHLGGIVVEPFPTRAHLAADASQVGRTLAICAYSPSAQAITQTASTTLVDIDATNLVVTFTAPATGKVLIRYSAQAHISNSTYGHLWGVQAGSTPVTSSYVATVGSGLTGYTGITRTAYVTGLTAGDSYTWKWGQYVTNGAATGDTIYGSGTYSNAAVMEIIAA